MTDDQILAVAREAGWNIEHRATNDYIIKFARALMDKHRAWFTVDELNEWASKLPQTTHWEGCDAVHPECKDLSNYESKTYKIGGFHLPEGFYSATELREMVKELDAMDAAAKRSMEEL